MSDVSIRVHPWLKSRLMGCYRKEIEPELGGSGRRGFVPRCTPRLRPLFTNPAAVSGSSR